MKILRLRLFRFGSFTEESEFVFPTEPGLYFMQGINKAEPRLQANGTGKSTVWKAISWVLFGKDARGMKAGDIANWETPQGAWVELDFEHEGRLWCVKRTHSPNSWKLSDSEGCWIDVTSDRTNSLLAVLRLEFVPFMNCVLMAQGQPMFLDLKAEAKASLFSEVMGLERWVEYSARAVEKAKAEDSRIRGFESHNAQLKGQLARLEQQDLTESIEGWEKERERRLDGIERIYGDYMLRSKQAKIEAATIGGEKLEELRLQLENLSKLVEKSEGGVNEAFSRLASEREALKVSDHEAERLDRVVRELKEDGKCPTCGNKGTSLDKVLAELEQACAGAKLTARNFYGYVAAAERRATTEEQRLKGLATKAQEARSLWQEGQRSASDAKRAYELVERKLDQLEAEGDAVMQELNPYLKLQDKAVAEGRQLREQLSSAQAEHDKSIERHAMLTFWTRGFKDVRLRMISEALEQLAIEVNSCVTALGLIGWELRFEVDRETKSGSISRGFSVFVKSPHNERLVPWESWSGGEAQRLRLATQEGLANLIRASTGATISLEVWDEPTAGLSAQGIDDLLNSLSERARTEGWCIWIVDHRTLGYGGFDGGTTIIKDDSGSRFSTGES